MKRFWIGAALLLVLAAMGIGSAVAMARIHGPISETLTLAAAAAQSGDAEKAEALAESARAKWEKNRKFSASCADHEPMEDIDSLFAAMEVYRQQGDTTEFAAACAQLSRLTKAMGDAHALNWWNLL